MIKILALLILCVSAWAQPKLGTPVEILPNPSNTVASQLRWRELRSNGTNYFALLASDSMASNVILYLPDTVGAVGNCLVTDGVDSLSWTACSGAPPFAEGTKIMAVDLGVPLPKHYWDLAASSGTTSAELGIRKSRGSIASPTTISSGEILGSIGFYGHNGSSFVGLAFLQVEADGATDSGAFRFLTVSGGGFATERWRIDKDGHLFPGGNKTQDVGKSGNAMRDVWTQDLYTETIKHPSSTAIPVTGNLNPGSAYGYDLGESGLRWDTLWTGNTEIDGIDGIGTGGLRFSGGNLQWSHDRSSWNNFVAGGGAAPFIDSTAIIYGSADATKLLAFEVDGFTTATTRTLTPQNASYTIAGLETAQTFTQDQTFSGHLLATTVGTKDIGSSANYFRTVYGKNFNGYVVSGTGSYVSTQKLDLYDGNGANSLWDIRAYWNPASNSLLEIRDNAGTPVIQFYRAFSGSAADYADVYVDLQPNADLGQDLGVYLTRRWDDGWINKVHTGNLCAESVSTCGAATGSTTFSVYGTYLPAFNNTYDIATSGTRMRKIYTVDIDVSGTATGLVQPTRTISTTSPLSGGGALSSNLTISCATCLTSGGQTISGAKTFDAVVNLTGSPALRISGTTVIDASRNFTNIADLRFTGQLWGPYTADATVNVTTSKGKVAYYDSSGTFQGWLVVFP